eukprot:COSAG06_NODE_785_length_12306_cov_22.984435_1_plen_47_part_10
MVRGRGLDLDLDLDLGLEAAPAAGQDRQSVQTSVDRLSAIHQEVDVV